jgi:hypothetical protein
MADLKENITKAVDSAIFCRQDIQAAMGKANPLEYMVIENLLRRSVALEQSLKQIADALND